MGKWKYRKLEPTHVRGMCVKCGISPQMSKGANSFRPLCQSCHHNEHPKLLVSRAQYKKNNPEKFYGYRVHKGDACVVCGFIPEHPCQLDVDHIDGDHSNNSLENLQTLCANCHRLKTLHSRDGIYKNRQ